jgi:Squalene/phytoene synthase
MSTVERHYAPILERPSPGAFVGAPDNQDDVIASHRGAHGSSYFWPIQLLPVRRREAMYALYAFCRELDDLADGEASRSLKQALLLNWRSEIAHLFAGRPQRARPPPRGSASTSTSVIGIDNPGRHGDAMQVLGRPVRLITDPRLRLLHGPPRISPGLCRPTPGSGRAAPPRPRRVDHESLS